MNKMPESRELQEMPEQVQSIKWNMEATLSHELDPFLMPNGNWKLTYTNRSGVKIFYVTVIFSNGRWTPKACSHVLVQSELFESA